MNLSSTTTAEDPSQERVGSHRAATLSSWLARERCVVATIDVQNDFCHPEGAIAKMGNDVSMVRQMMPGLNRLLTLARENEVPIVHVRTGLSDWFDTPAWKLRGLFGVVFDSERVPVVQEGTWGSDFFRIEPTPGELILTKYRYSAFTYTPLELALRSKSAETLIIAGTATHQCVEATGREAIGLGFLPVVVRDAVASRRSFHHEFALEDFEAHLGAVVSTDELVAAWESEVSASKEQLHAR